MKVVDFSNVYSEYIVSLFLTIDLDLERVSQEIEPICLLTLKLLKHLYVNHIGPHSIPAMV